ncbi:transcription termination factor Rho [Nocardia alni]|uniref:transcription termination factor Rho n=1 Tax=Nocardia alni TaxID=2815723 RepID=UPI001C2194D7|nr:transcription termination factor Rho [Nocardia alni]
MTDTDLLATPEVEANGRTPGARESDSGQISKMSEQTDVAQGLTGMLLPQLRALAGELGIRGTSGMRKGDLIAAIKENQAGTTTKLSRGRTAPAGEAKPEKSQEAEQAPQAPAQEQPKAAQERPKAARAEQQTLDGMTDQPAEQAKADSPARPADSGEEGGRDAARARGRQRRGRDQRSGASESKAETNGTEANAEAKVEAKVETKSEAKSEAKSEESGERRRDRNQQNGNQAQNNQGNQNRNGADRGDRDRDRADRAGDDEDGRGRRGRRFRERRRGRDREGAETGGGPTREVEIREDDVLQPVAGILDVLDNYAFVRTSGYLAGPNDVYVSMNLVRKNGLRRGDAITGAVRAPREGDQANQRQKFDPLVRLDTVNGADVEAARRRPEFNKLTPLYPNQRLRLETTPNKLTTRIIDLIMPVGKGQRALIVSPPKAGKTTILQDMANAIATNNPEVYLMVVLVDERPEEVTDMQRTVRGEVIASTFDRPPSDHTSVAELAIERAKRLVEQGQDVVVLLDSITRLGRAYNNSSPASGRILSGGIDSTALYPPKRFLGAARNIENGGSLTIVATAMVETGSTGDTVIFEEFKGTGNAELKLDRKIAERRVFPAVDVNPSSTRRDDLLMAPDEAAVVHKLRRVLSGLDSHQAIDLLMDRLKKTKNNMEFLLQVSKTAPGAIDD